MKMIFLFLFSSVDSLFSDLTYSDKLSPYPISWPSSWVPSHLSLDSNHLSSSPILQIFFSIPETSEDLSSYYSEVILPGVNGTQMSCSLSRFSSFSNDWSAKCESDSLQKATTYGPVHFMISKLPTSQIFAEDKLLGYFRTLEEQAEGSLFVTSFSPEEVEVNDEAILEFSFELASNEFLYPGDYFELKVDSHFSVDLEDTFVDWNQSSDSTSFNSMKAKFVQSSSVQLFIYDLKSEVIEATSVKFRKSGFKAPSVEVNFEDQQWTLNVCRFGTNTIIKTLKTSIDLLTGFDVKAGKISIVQWSSVNGIPSSELFSGLATNFLLEFQSADPIPAAGTVTVKYSGITVDSFSYKTDSYQVRSTTSSTVFCNSSVEVSCEVVDSVTVKVTIGDLPLPAENSIFLYNLIKFSSSSTYFVESIISWQGSSKIGEFSQGLQESFVLNKKSSGFSLISSNVKVYFTESDISATPVYEITKSGNHGLVVQFKVSSEGFSVDDLIEITFPMVSQSASDWKRSVFQGPGFALCAQDSTSEFSSSTFASTRLEALVTFSDDKIVVKLKQAITASNILVLYIGAGSSSDVGLVKTPVFTTIPSDLAEIVVKYKKSVSGTLTTFYYVSSIYFKEAALEAVSMTFFCDAALGDGSPARVSYTAKEYSAPTGYKLGAFFTFSSSTGSGYQDLNLASGINLPVGSRYPSSDSSNAYTLSSSTTLNTTIYSNLRSNEAKKIVIPLPAVTSSKSFKVKVEIYAIKAGFTVIIFSSTSSATTTSGSSLTNKASLDVSSIQINKDSSLKVTFSDLTPSEDYSLLVILPQGFEFIQSNGVLVTSKDPTAQFVALFKEKAFTPTTDSYSYTVHLKSYLKNQNSLSVFAVFKGETFQGGTCSGISTAITVSNASPLTLLSYSPGKIDSYQYNNRTFDFEANFRSSSKIFKDSVISISLSFSEDYIASQGFQSFQVFAGSNEISGSYSSGYWTGNFEQKFDSGTVINVKITEIPKPEESVKIEAIYSLTVEYDSNNYISWYHSEYGIPIGLTLLEGIQSIPSKANVWVFPSVSSSERVFFGFEFKTSLDIPIGSEFIIQGQFEEREITEGYDERFDVWCSHTYKDVNITKDSITLITAEDIPKNSQFKLLVDSAFDIPSNLSKSDPFYLKVTSNDKNSTVLIEDNNETISQATFDIIAENNKSLINAISLNCFSSIAGMLSTCRFDFDMYSNNETFVWIHFQPSKNFNAIPGILDPFSEDLAKTFKYESSADLSECRAMHWLVSCLFRSLPVNFYFSMILKTPAAPSFKVYLLRNDNMYDIYETETSIEQSLDKGMIDIRKVVSTLSSSKLTHSLKIFAKMNLKLKVNGKFLIYFSIDLNPARFLQLSCFVGVTANETMKESNLVEVFKGPCYINQDFISIELEEDFNISKKNWTLFKIEGLPTPFKGKAQVLFDFEDIGIVNDFYSESMKIIYIDEENTAVASSFDNIAAAFAGYNTSSLKRVSANNDESVVINKGTIQGPFSLEPSDGFFDTEVLRISCKVVDSFNLHTSKIKINPSSFLLNLSYPSSSFQIIIDAVDLGNYFILWELQELPFIGSISSYLKPQNTMIQVIDKQNYTISIETEDIQFNSKMNKTLPVKVKINHDKVRPFHDLQIFFYSMNQQYLISPSPVIFNENSAESYIFISLANDTDRKKDIIQADIFGREKKYFVFKQILNLSYNSKLIIQSDPEVWTEISNISSCGFDVTVEVNSTSLVTWCLYSKFAFNKFDLSESDFYSMSNSIEFPSEFRDDFNEKSNKIKRKTQELKDLNINYYVFSKAIIQYYRFNSYFCSQSLIESSEVISFNLLAPDTEYFFEGYAQESTNNSYHFFNSVNTSSLPSHARLYFTLPDNKIDIRGVLMNFFKLPDLNFKISTKTSKSNKKVNHTVTVYSTPGNDYNPYQDLVNRQSEMIELLPVKTIFKFKEYVQKQDFRPEFEYSLELVDNFNAKINFTATVTGELICVLHYDLDENITISVIDVYYGVNVDYGENGSQDIYPQIVYNVQKGIEYEFELDFSDMDTEKSDYFIKCMLCDNFPGNPACSEVTGEQFNYENKNDFSLFLGICSILPLILY